MDIVLPLLASDLPRYVRLQRPTFERFYSDLDVTWIYSRPEDVAEVRDATSEMHDVRVLSDLDLVPELKLARAVRRDVTRGWYQQQLIKLAAVPKADTPFVLVVDADVVAVRDVCDADIVEYGRAIRNRTPVTAHGQWVEWAGVALDLPPLGYTAAVTPHVLARDAMRELADFARQRVRPRKRIVRTASLVPGFRRYLTTWRGRLLGALPWTEQQLYDTFLVGTGRFEKYHRYSEDVILHGNSVWHANEFESWDPRVVPDSQIHFFSVVQGAADIPVDAVQDKLKAAGILADD